MSWVAYCKYRSCEAFKQMFVVNRGYGIFKLSKEITEMTCPVCKKNVFEIRNVGFVNTEWALRGKLREKDDSKVFGDGKTYDGKLYTFKETNYMTAFEQLEIMAKRIKDSKIINFTEYEEDEPSQCSSNTC